MRPALRVLAVLLGLVLSWGAHAQGNSPTVSVALTAPASGAVIVTPGSIELAATASINRDIWQILRVVFYSGATLVGTATASPTARPGRKCRRAPTP